MPPQSDATRHHAADVSSPFDDAPKPLRYGPYSWGEPVGSGGMARVHIARRVGATDDELPLAAKRILPEHSRKERFARMFTSEARICASLDHPNIVRAVDFGEQDGELVLVMEYVDGFSCSELLRLSARRDAPMPMDAALFIALEVLEALEYAHSVETDSGVHLGIVHRDVSPGNILVGNTGALKLTDFGVARSNDCPRDTRPGALKGNYGYMSPEQIGGWEVDRRSDLFSFGVVLFELLKGKPLFEGSSDFEILARTYEADISPLAEPGAGLPLELRLILASALSRDPKERFHSAGEFAEALGAFARHAGLHPDSTALTSWLATLDLCPAVSRRFPAMPLELDDTLRPEAPTRRACTGS